jgi:hypothetical protein
MSRILPVILVFTVAACAENEKKDTNTAANAGGSNATPAPSVDKGRCDASGKKLVEIDVNQDKKPDVWKIYAGTVENGAKVDVLTCKEVDLNFDGKKDMWVYYDNGGNITLEEFDLDFDGKLDLWTYRQNGKISRQELDTNFDGKTDIWKFFEAEKLARIERSTQKNGKVDVWEYYEGGKLDRIGYDTTGSGQVDKWDRAPEEQGGGSTQQASDKPAAPKVAPETVPQPPPPAPAPPPPAPKK